MNLKLPFKNINLKTITDFMFIFINFKIIIAIVVIYYYYINHPFWFYKDAVNNCYLVFYKYFNKGIINKYPTYHIETHNKIFNIKSHNVIDNNIVSFINDNYSNNINKYKYDRDFLNNIINSKENLPTIYSINSNKTPNNIIAIGIGYNSKLIIYGIEYLLYYADYLCVSTTERGKGVFKTLFNHALTQNINSKCPLFLFKKDYNPLPIKHLIKYTYHLVFDLINDKSNESFFGNLVNHINNITILSNDLLLHNNQDIMTHVYDLYLQNIRGKSIYNILSKDEFINYLNNDNIHIYIYSETYDKLINVINVICIYDTHIHNTQSNKDIYEIIFTLRNTRYESEFKHTDIIEELKNSMIMKIRSDFRDKYIITSSINGNYDLSSVKNAKKYNNSLSTCYYYLYNFNNEESGDEDVFLLYL